MAIEAYGSSFRKALVAGIASLTLAGAMAGVTPAQAFAVANSGSAIFAPGASAIETVAYSKPLPCQGKKGLIAKKYCRH